MSEAELIFTALAELSTTQLAEPDKANGVNQTADAGKNGRTVANYARLTIENETGRKGSPGEHFLRTSRHHKN